MLGIARREFHDSIVDLVKRKRLAMKPDAEKSVEVRAALLDEMAAKDEREKPEERARRRGMTREAQPKSTMALQPDPRRRRRAGFRAFV